MQEAYKRLREELEGCRQVLALDQAVLAAVLERTGGAAVSREDIRRHLREKTQVRAEYSPEEGGCRLWTERSEAVE